MRLALAAAGFGLTLTTALVAEPPIPARPQDLRFADDAPAFPDPSGRRHALRNGIVVFVEEDHSLPLVEIALALGAGDFLDPPDRVGLAGLTAALLRRGGAGTWTPDAFDAEADRLGADLASRSTGLRSGASLECSRRVLDEALGLFIAMVRAPRFEADRLDLARSNLRESIRRRDDDPLRVLDRIWGRLLFGPDHFSTREVEPRHLDAIQRTDLVAFHRAHWRPADMVLAVSGDVRAAEIVADLDRRLGDWRPEEIAAVAPAPIAVAEHRPQPGLYLRDRPLPQVKIALGHRGPQRASWSDPAEAPLVVLGEILGGDGAVSRLRRRLRAEAGLVYRASAHIGLGQRGPGAFQVFLEAEPRHAGRALELARAEVVRLREEPVHPEELRLARRSLLSTLPLLFDSAEKRAGRFAEDVLLGRPHGYWTDFRDRLTRVTAEDVQAAARRHLRPADLVVVVVGDWAQIAAGARADGVALEHRFGRPRDPV